MRLTLQSQRLEKVVVIRCKGRVSFGADVDALQAEVDKQTKIEGTDIYNLKHVVLQLREADYIDSSGLGALVRLYGVLRAAGGGLNLCELSPAILKTIEITNLGVLFPPYATEAEAIDAFSIAQRDPSEPDEDSKTRIVCVDTSNDLLAGLSALLTSSGYEVFTTRYVGQAATLVNATDPKVMICGPGMMAVPTGPAVIENIRKNGGKLQIMHLPSDFHISEAGQAGQDLVLQVRSLVAD
jgi:stage II sporulation protein AA (anti-sigma F factor antagonist)